VVRRGVFCQKKEDHLLLSSQLSEELSTKDKKALAINEVSLLSEYVKKL
jgi:hypothetical protein